MDRVFGSHTSYSNETGSDIDAMAVMDLYDHPEGNLDITYE
jgi:hypothetical protein